ncbi:Fic family protein [Salinisphaera sp. Q1T1-3]|uniref:Fic family protein n=1 Tax=Salinisphaera sp. Q1T1-3 TaxID=2321229 RepID=UPI000E73DDFC|nr:Fic family protein [Salinisphaera sp. Q1T1-3]RJS91142.1 Fic family protein [Salinisphaera sp. Q1T1-3]
MVALPSLKQLDPGRFETVAIFKRLNATTRRLAELKGVASTIPNQSILINTLGIQEAKDSSAIENIITTHDELFRGDATEPGSSLQAKEVYRYREALFTGYDAVRRDRLITNRHIQTIQATLERNAAGFRRIPGTALRNGYGETIYTPPSPEQVPALMTDLEAFINDDALFAIDPLIKMALLHYQFESIHPFYDGNGRTGRILNVLYLVKNALLDIPVLYMSRHIVRTKDEYYRRLQAVRDDDAWEAWVEYMLIAVEQTAGETIETIQAIKAALQRYKHQIRERHKFYSQDLINNLFMHPYTKIAFVQDELQVSRITATKYLDELVADGFLKKERLGRTNFYVNIALNDILTGESMTN